MARGALIRLGAVHARGLSASSVHGRPGYWSSLGVLGEDGMVLSAAANDDPSAKYGFTFSRASTGTYIGASGLLETAASGVQRRQIDPVTGQAFWLHEQQSTNLVPNTTSESAAGSGFTSSTGRPDPFGGTGAVRVVANAATEQHYSAVNGVAFTAGTTYTVSVYVDPETCAYLQLLPGSSAAFTTFDEYANFQMTVPRSVTFQGAGCIAAGIDAPVNGLCRLWVTAVADATAAFATGAIVAMITSPTHARNPLIAGAGLQMTRYGTQIEAGPLSSYIVPAGATTTRAADSLTLVGTVGNVASWFNNTEGTFVWRGRLVGTTSTKYPALVGVGNGSSGSHEHVVYVTAATNVIRSEAKNAGVVTLTSEPAGGVTVGADFVASYAYADNYALAVRSGVAGAVDSSGALPTGLDRISIGGYNYRGGTAEGSLLISSIEYYPRTMSAAEQLALTV